MLNLEFSLTLLNLIIMIGAAVAIGYLLRSQQLKKKQFKISELRKEIVYNHAHILELQKEYVGLEKSIHGNQATILPMKAMISDVKESAAL